MKIWTSDGETLYLTKEQALRASDGGPVYESEVISMIPLLRKEFVKSVENKTAYDYIAENYWQFHKDHLKDIILECLYAMENTPSYNKLAELLKERWEDELNEEN